MAGFNLSFNSTFQPFSFERYLQPYKIYGEEYKAQEGAYAKAATEAELIGDLIDPYDERDAEYYNQYNQYMADIEKASSDMAKEGLTPGGRKNILELTQRYADELQPIKTASDARNLLAKEQFELEKTGKDIRFEKRASEMSLSDFMGGTPVTPRSYSGAIMANQVSEAAKSLSKQMRQQPRKWQEILGGQYYETLNKGGFSPEEVMAAISRNPEANRELSKILDDAVASSGVLDWEGIYDEEGNLTEHGNRVLNEAYTLAGRGLWSAVGEDKYDTKENWMGKANYQDALRRRDSQITGGVAPNPLFIYSQNDIKNKTNTYKNWSKYFTKNSKGEIVLSKEGKEEYGKSHMGSLGPTPMFGTPQLGKRENSPFHNFIENELLKEGETIESVSPAELGRRWNEVASLKEDDLPDAYRVTEYDYTYDPSQQDNIKQSVITASGNLPLRGVDYSGKDSKFKLNGKELSLSDLSSKNYKIVSSRFSPYGNTLIIQNNKGETERYQMPEGINTFNEMSRDRAMEGLSYLQNILSTGEFIESSGKVRKASKEELIDAKNRYNELLQRAYMYHSQIGMTNKTEPQSFGNYPY